MADQKSLTMKSAMNDKLVIILSNQMKIEKRQMMKEMMESRNDFRNPAKANDSMSLKETSNEHRGTKETTKSSWERMERHYLKEKIDLKGSA